MKKLTIDELNKLKLKVSYSKKYKGCTYPNIPAALSIEITNYEKEKVAFTYLYTFCFNDYYMQFRTYEDYLEAIKILASKLNLTNNKVLLIYVYDLSLAFQFIKYKHNWIEVFAKEINEPIKARTEFIEYRCLKTYSNLKLAKIGANLKQRINIPDIDETTLRTSKTSLNEELEQSLIKCEAMHNYIKEQLEIFGNISKLPLTSTGKVRNFVRSKCLTLPNGKKNYDYLAIMRKLNIKLDDYKHFAEPAYFGGYSNTNPLYENEIINNLESYDLTSSYPATCLRFRFPMTEAKYIKINTKEDLEELYKYKRCFIITFKALEVNSKLSFDFLDKTVATLHGKTKIRNNKIQYAEELIATLTNVDFEIFKDCYSYSKILYAEALYFGSDYLPKELMNSIIELYKNKQYYKDKDITLYNLNKQSLDSVYGMICQKPIKPLISYKEGKFKISEDFNEQEALNKYNDSYNKFLYFYWGLFICSYARKRLFDMIKVINSDLIYTDTDSLKLINTDKYRDLINKDNELNNKEIEAALKTYNIDFESVKGIGCWKFEGVIDIAKFIGQKAYLTLCGDKYELTMAGVTKDSGIKCLLESPDIFNDFKEGFSFDKERSGKLERVILDRPLKGVIMDVNGLKNEYSEESGIYTQKLAYTIGELDELRDFITGSKPIGGGVI